MRRDRPVMNILGFSLMLTICVTALVGAVCIYFKW
jgi:hypothetical protein